jgi:predicted Zn-dependent protease
LIVTMLVGCEAGGAGEGPGGRRQLLGLTPDQELALGRQAYQEILRKSRVVRGGPEVERVRDVGRRIAKAAAIEPLQREIHLRVKGYKFEWEANVLEDSHINAFCLPGGKIAVFTGLFQVARSDDALATVMSHEIAHALAHHASERVAREQMEKRAIQAANGALGGMDPGTRRHLIGLLAAGAEVNSLKYDRRQESEADHIGVFLMTFAGYNPEEAIRFWLAMQEASGRAHVPAILSDHPSDSQRIAQMKQWVPLAERAKRAFDAGNIAPPR